jgi:hypothetical protein
MINEHIAKQRSNVLVIALVGGKLADKWWSSPNAAFDMRTPASIWLEDYTKVYTYLMRAASK